MQFLLLVRYEGRPYLPLYENADHNPNRRNTDMAAFDTNRYSTSPAGFAGHIGQTFVSMTAFDTAAKSAVRVSLADRFGQYVATLAASYTDWKDQRATRKALSALSDRELDDIGLSRADLDTLR